MAPETDLYFEDYVPGAVREFGPIVVGEEEILDFARRYDPQPIHTDTQWARNGPFGGLVASGWHTTAIMMRLRWLRPVRPGDELRVRVTVLEARPSRSKPDRGLLRSRIEVLAADGSAVMTLIALNMIRRRPDATS
jgi:acyl dehydratase